MMFRTHHSSFWSFWSHRGIQSIEAGGTVVNPEKAQAQREAKRAEREAERKAQLDARIQREVDAEPPLSDEQRTRLAALLRMRSYEQQKDCTGL